MNTDARLLHNLHLGSSSRRSLLAPERLSWHAITNSSSRCNRPLPKILDMVRSGVGSHDKKPLRLFAISPWKVLQCGEDWSRATARHHQDPVLRPHMQTCPGLLRHNRAYHRSSPRRSSVSESSTHSRSRVQFLSSSGAFDKYQDEARTMAASSQSHPGSQMWNGTSCRSFYGCTRRALSTASPFKYGESRGREARADNDHAGAAAAAVFVIAASCFSQTPEQTRRLGPSD